MATKKRDQHPSSGSRSGGPPAAVPASSGGAPAAPATPATAATPATPAITAGEPCYEYRLVTDEQGNPVYRMVEVPCK